MDVQEEDSLDPFPTEEMQPIDESMIPKMKPLPDEQNYGKEMALSVALEMEEKRRNTKETTEDGSKEDQVDDEEDDNIVYSLGIISHKKSLITIFGHKHKMKNFIKKGAFFSPASGKIGQS